MISGTIQQMGEGLPDADVVERRLAHIERHADSAHADCRCKTFRF